MKENPSGKTLSIVIPAFNEGGFIATCLERVISADTLGMRKEIIVIDDASTDGTLDVVKDYAGKHTEITLIPQKKNEGKGAALKEGFLRSKGDIVLVQDADLEYHPRDYPYLLSPILEDQADVVYGSRFISNRPHRVLYFWHFVANAFLTLLSNMVTNLNISDMETGYKVFRGDIIRRIAPKLKSKRFGFEPEITARLAKIKGIKIYEVGISYRGRTYEEGKKIGVIDGVRALWEIVYFNFFDRS